jgi:hypothetical protein
MTTKFHPAFKHGGYSNTTLLPGEDKAAFEKLLKDIIAEFEPAGRIEEDIVKTMARINWRKQNLQTYRLAAEAKARYWQIRRKFFPTPPSPFEIATAPIDKRDPKEIEQANHDFEEQARKELGDDLELAAAYTITEMFDEWSVIERLDAMIDRCIKRLLMVRGVKSMSISAPSASSNRKRRSAA